MNMDEPAPRCLYLPYERVRWTVTAEELLPVPRHLHVPYSQVVESRRSIRTFAPISESDLSTLLWLTAGTRDVSSTDSSVAHRAAPSAGGLHPIHLLIVRQQSPFLVRYHSGRHVLEQVKCEHADAVAVMSDASKFMPAGGASLIVFAAEPGITASRYHHSISLVWRDAGVLQGQLCFAASALGLACCLLGATGDAWLTTLLSESRLLGMGAALVGARQ